MPAGAWPSSSLLTRLPHASRKKAFSPASLVCSLVPIKPLPLGASPSTFPSLTPHWRLRSPPTHWDTCCSRCRLRASLLPLLLLSACSGENSSWAGRCFHFALLPNCFKFQGQVSPFPALSHPHSLCWCHSSQLGQSREHILPQASGCALSCLAVSRSRAQRAGVSDSEQKLQIPLLSCSCVSVIHPALAFPFPHPPAYWAERQE